MFSKFSWLTISNIKRNSCLSMLNTSCNKNNYAFLFSGKSREILCHNIKYNGNALLVEVPLFKIKTWNINLIHFDFHPSVTTKGWEMGLHRVWPTPQGPHHSGRVVPVPWLGSKIVLTLLVGTWGSWPDGVRVGELVLPPPLPCGDEGQGKDALPPVACYLQQVRALALFLTSYNTWKIRPSTLPGRLSTADPVDWGTGKQARTYEHGKSGLAPHLPYSGMCEGEIPPPPIPPRTFTSCSSQESGPSTSPVSIGEGEWDLKV